MDASVHRRARHDGVTFEKLIGGDDRVGRHGGWRPVAPREDFNVTINVPSPSVFVGAQLCATDVSSDPGYSLRTDVDDRNFVGAR